MKTRLLVLALVLLMLALTAGTVLAGGARNATFIRFLQAGFFEYGPFYCEGYYQEIANGIVHGWRENPECVPYAPGIPEYKVHMVFKPIPKFSEPDCDDEGLIIAVGPWSLDPGYQDLEGDEADLTDIFGPYGEQQYWVCFYHWDTTD